jgi:hypothetical protein
MDHLSNRALAKLRIALLSSLSMLLLPLGGCGNDKIPVEVTGYDHMNKRAILWFTVNGASGPNLFPESGGGKYNCCIEIPRRWQPGMKAKVRWEYGSGDDSPRETEVEVPEYTPQNLGAVQVHFYADHKVKVVVSRYEIESPCGPLREEEKAPWETQRDLIDYYRTGDGKDEHCDGPGMNL